MLSPAETSLSADVLEITDLGVRKGLHSKYFIDGIDDSFLIFKIKKIGNRVFGIVANENHSRTLAVYQNKKWIPLVHPDSVSIAANSFDPKEVWITSDDGEKHQAYLFGDSSFTTAVVWLHGGPKENVSPRYSDYFAELNKNKSAVLALNYPGSTGRGREYEEKFTKEHNVSALRATFRYLKENNFQSIVTWSISTGAVLQRYILEEKLPVSGMIDQAGGYNKNFSSLVKASSIPYFGIRGKNDMHRSQKFFSFIYKGGHDITYEPQFATLMSKVIPFIESVSQKRDESVKKAFFVD